MADSDYDNWVGFQSTTLTSITPDDLDPDVEFEIQLRAVAQDGIASDWTDSVYFTTPADVTPPSIPSVPIVVSRLGTFQITWDGKTEDGGTMEPDWSYVRVFANGLFIGSVSVPGGGSVVWSEALYNTDYTFTLSAVDTTGNESAMSASVTAQVTPLVDTDIIGKIINASDNVIDGSITDVQIGDLAVTAGKIAVDAVTAEKIADNAVTGPAIESSAVTADKLSANSVTAGKIATNAVTAGTIDAEAVTANTIAAGAVITEKIAANAVTVDKLAAASVTTDKLRVGVASNAVADPNFQSDAINALRMDGNSSIYVAGNGSRSFRVTNGNGYRVWLIGNKTASTSTSPPAWSTADQNGWVPVSPGTSWSFSGEFIRNGAGGSVRFQVNLLDGTGMPIGTANYLSITALADNTQTTVEGALEIPAGAAWLAAAWVFDTDGGTTSDDRIRTPKAWQQVGSVLIEDGAVTANKIQALAVTADKISANAITSDKISAGAIDGMTITGAVVAGGKVISAGRTDWNDTNQGWWIDSDGYANVHDSTGTTFVEVNPRAGAQSFQVGPSNGNYLKFSAATGKLTVTGDIQGGNFYTGDRIPQDFGDPPVGTGVMLRSSGYMNATMNGNMFFEVSPIRGILNIGNSTVGLHVDATAGTTTFTGPVQTAGSQSPRVAIGQDSWGGHGWDYPNITLFTKDVNSSNYDGPRIWSNNDSLDVAGTTITGVPVGALWVDNWSHDNVYSHTFLTGANQAWLATTIGQTTDWASSLRMDYTKGLELTCNVAPITFRSSNGYIFNPLPTSTTATYAALQMDPTTGQMYRTASLSALKLDQQPIALDYCILDLTGKTWVDSAQYAANPTASLPRYAGFVAEDVQTLSQANGNALESLLLRDDAGVLQGVAYDRVVAYLVGVIKDMNTRLTSLESA